MSVKAQTIFETALSIMDEVESAEHFRGRAVPILNTLIGDCWRVSEEHEKGPHSTWKAIATLEDTVEGIDQTLALSAMPYGLAAQLYLENDPIRANSWWQIYQEQYEKCRRSPMSIEPIVDEYGGVEAGCFGRW